MVQHKYWGKVEENWAGFSAEKVLTSSYFNTNNGTIFLGEEYDEEGEEIVAFPSAEELDDFENTYSSFIVKLDKVLEDIKEKTFERYRKLYASFYEDKEKSGEDPLDISTKEKHFDYIQDLGYIRVLENGVIKIIIRYKLDTEHGMEIKLKDNTIVDIAGIAET